MNDVANSLKGTDFFDGNLNLKEKFRSFSEYSLVLIKNLNNKDYKFTINQIKRMSTKTLLFLSFFLFRSITTANNTPSAPS